MKKVLYFATAALALSACSSDDFLGEDRPNLGGAEELAISLDGGTGVLTRAAKSGSDAATALNNKFVVYGYKTVSSTPQKVYDHYSVVWGGAPGSTASNSAGWEYVGQELNKLTSLPTGAEQEIKYWDFAASQYDFIAFSTGLATQVEAESDVDDGKVYVTAITPTSTPVSPDTYTGPKYTIKGAVADLAKCYISDRVTAENGVADANKIANRYVAYKDAVQFNFRSLSSKVRLAIYETIPGYSVKDVTFYKAVDTTAPTATAPTLFAEGANIPGGTGTMTVTFPTTDKAETDYNKAHVAFTGGTNTKDLTFSALTYTTREKLEESTGTAEIFLGRTSATATYAGDATAADHAYVNVLPAEAGALTLKVNYTLVSRDGSEEEIYVEGATAVVPAEYCTWQPNYAYTYIFKISDKTNGQIGGEAAGLYPITFDAIVTETEDGIQETITTVATPSITTYAKGAVKDEYCADDHIYVNVEGVEVSATNLKLYTASTTSTIEKITEGAVANAIANGGKADINGGVLTVTATTASFMEIVDEIDADDAPDGNAVSLANKAGKFTAAGSTTYVAEYKVSDTEKYYKVIVVGSTAR